jgi:hypothetical protein
LYRGHVKTKSSPSRRNSTPSVPVFCASVIRQPIPARQGLTRSDAGANRGNPDNKALRPAAIPTMGDSVGGATDTVRIPHTFQRVSCACAVKMLPCPLDRSSSLPPFTASTVTVVFLLRNRKGPPIL